MVAASVRRLLWVAALPLFCGAVRAQDGVRSPVEPSDPTRTAQEATPTVFAEEVPLEHLVTACAHALDVPLEYDPEKLAGRVRLRPGVPYSPDEILEILNRELVARGMTTVQPPGFEGLRVVPLQDAASLARLEAPSLAGARAGFVKVLVALAFRTPDELSPTIQLLLSKPHGALAAAKESGTLLLADLRPHVAQILAFLDLLDRGLEEPEVVEIELAHTSPTQVAALMERITATRKVVAGRALRGSLLPIAESRSVLLIAPEEELDWWRGTVRRFDRPEPTTTVDYAPRRFGLAETAKLLEEVVRGTDSEKPWRVVVDQLSGTLIVSTTPSRHREIEKLLARLAATEEGPRRPMRAFSIKNRQVSEVQRLLEDLLEAGVLEKAEPAADAEAQAQGVTGPLPARGPAVVGTRPGSKAEVTITADEATNRLIAFGEARLLDQLGSLIATLDVRHAQVMVEVLVVSLTDTQTRDLGVELQKIGTADGVQYQLASLFGLGSTPPTASTLPAASGTGFSGAVLDPGSFSAVVRALETLNKGRSLTVPKVLVANNQQATLDSVLQTPYASTNASTTVATTTFGGTLDAGTAISVKPQVADGDRIVLEYTVSLSSFTGEAQENLPPPRQENKLKSVATIPDGHTVVVGGLDVESDTRAKSRVPLLGELPLVGGLFTDRSDTRTRTRFFVFLRCSAVQGSRYEDLRYLSGKDLAKAGLGDGWPVLEPRVIR